MAPLNEQEAHRPWKLVSDPTRQTALCKCAGPVWQGKTELLIATDNPDSTRQGPLRHSGTYRFRNTSSIHNRSPYRRCHTLHRCSLKTSTWMTRNHSP